jgi:nucleotide-binding universal stress UspA family protein
MTTMVSAPLRGGHHSGARGHRVVVGVAGHAASAATLAWAIAEAEATDAELVVVHATGARRSGRAAGGSDVGARASLAALETVDRTAASAVAAARTRLGEASVRIDVEPGTAGELLVRAAGPRDLMVIGGPQRSGWWVRTGTTYQAVTRARCPVIVVHEAYGSAEPGWPTAAGGTVVVAVEAGVPAAGPLRFGAEFARLHGAGLDVLEGRSADVVRRAAAHAALLVIGSGGTALHPLGGSCRSLVASAACPVAVIHGPRHRRRGAGGADPAVPHPDSIKEGTYVQVCPGT